MVWTRAPGDLRRCDTITAASEPDKAGPQVPVEGPVAAAIPAPAPSGTVDSAPVPSTAAVAVEGAATPAPAAARIQARVRRAMTEKKAATPVQRQAVAARKSHAVDYDYEQVHVRLARGGCAVTVGAVGTFKFPC